MKLMDIINLQETIKFMLDEKLPFRTSYKLTKFANLIEEEIEYYNTELKKLIDQYAEKDENNQPKFTEEGAGIILIPETKMEFYDKFSELQLLEIDKNFPTFKLEELDIMKIPPKLIMTFSQLIEEE